MTSEPGEFGAGVIEDRQEEIRERQRELGAQNLERAYEELAEGDVDDAFTCGLYACYLLSGGVQFLKVWSHVTDAGYENKHHQWLSRAIQAVCKGAGVRQSQFQLETLQACYERTGYHPARYTFETTYLKPDDMIQILGVVETLAHAIDAIEDDSEPVHTMGEDFEDSWLHQEAMDRREDGRDLKVLIYARNQATGVGKTTLAVQLCQKWDNDWTADRAANTADGYLRTFSEVPMQSVILADEIGTMFDSRRSMAGENLDATQLWDIMRKWEKWTIATLPGASTVDKRIRKKADVWIVVRERGLGRVLEVGEDDVTGQLKTKGHGFVKWGAMDEDDQYQAVEDKKDELMQSKIDDVLGEDRDEDEPDEIPAAVRKEVRNETIRTMVENGMTQTEVAEVLELTQPTISDICRQGDDED